MQLLRARKFDLEHVRREPFLKVLGLFNSRTRQPHMLSGLGLPVSCKNSRNYYTNIINDFRKSMTVKFIFGKRTRECLEMLFRLIIRTRGRNNGYFDRGLGRATKDNLRCEASTEFTVDGERELRDSLQGGGLSAGLVTNDHDL